MGLILDQLVAALRGAATYNRHDQAAPQLVLWPDAESAWWPVVDLLADAVPELLVLDQSSVAPRRGPSTRVRYLLSRHERRETPVVYLPGVSRQAFRNAAGFPPVARHLYALQFQGQFWTQQNGTDWTPLAFLASGNGGLGLDVARDRETVSALAAQLPQVLQTPADDLRGRRLEAADFHGLVAKDPIRLLLSWIGDPDGFRVQRSGGRWEGFRAVCRETFRLDPDKDGAITAVERLVIGRGIWDQVWARYSESPGSFPGVRQALDRAQPKDWIDAQSDRIPASGRQQEDELRRDLEALADMPHRAAVERLHELCRRHAPRASSLWARMGEAPLARAAEFLGVMLENVDAGLPGADWEALAESYSRTGWMVDLSALRAVNAVREARDLRVVITALRAVYLPWLEELAVRIAPLSQSYPRSSPAGSLTLTPKAGEVVLFVDGLRCDLGLELRKLLEAKHFSVDWETSWTALPTVTATAKPAWQPLAAAIAGNNMGDGFEPQVAATGRPLRTAEFRRLLSEVGFTWLDSAAPGDPTGSAWTEIGSFDHYGHQQGVRLAWRIEEELAAVVSRVEELRDAGWRQVTVVTDHGWLYAPGGLSKVDLPRHLAVTAWGRCAIPEGNAQHGFPQVSWYWGGGHAVVLAPGISAFRGGLEYAHGGLSIQEALTPVLRITADAVRTQNPRLTELRWVGLRLHIQIDDLAPGLQVDLRTKPADAGTSVLSGEQRAKSPDAQGKLSLIVSDDERAGEAAVVVLILNGLVIAKRAVTIGEN